MFEILDKLVRFLKRFLLWLIPHFLLFCGIGIYFAVEMYGAEGAKNYYIPLLIAFAAALAFSGYAYFCFGRENKKYTAYKLGEFDKSFVYGYFSGKYTKILREAVIDLHLSDFNTALEKFDELSKKDLSDGQTAVLSFYTGRCYQLMGYPANGVKYYENALELGLKLNDTYLLAARCLVQNGRFNEALEYYNILLERNSYYDFILTDMGIAYLKMGDSEKALELFEKSVDEGKNYSFALGGCSLAYLQMKNLEKSSEYYSEALRCNMEDVNGFKIFYCNIAESVGLLDEIDPNIRLHSDPCR